MVIKGIKGYELEKARPNTSEDFFNQSEVVFIDGGVEKTLHVLYVRYFDEILHEFVPFEKDPLFTVEEKSVSFKDVVGLLCLLHQTAYKNRKRLYISDKKELQNICSGVNPDELKQIVTQIFRNGYEIKE